MKRNNLKRVDIIPFDFTTQVPNEYKESVQSLLSAIRSHEKSEAIELEVCALNYSNLLRIIRLAFYTSGRHNDPHTKMLSAVINQLPIAQYN